ncbi:hypothetical protein HDU67_003214 [Dinochytrium kinnereticum]|nr:hypothetical protein HDU67_003214 [Dinochytrium kinnereticum]
MSPYTPHEPSRYAGSISSRSTSSEFRTSKPAFPISEDLARAVMSDAASEDEGFLSESGSYRDRARHPLSRPYTMSFRDKLPSSVAVSVGSSLRDTHSYDDASKERQQHEASALSMGHSSENYRGGTLSSSEWERDHPSEQAGYKGRAPVGSTFERVNRSGSAAPEGVSRIASGGADYDADYYSEAESQTRSFRSRENSLTSSVVNGYYSDIGGGSREVNRPRPPFRRESGNEIRPFEHGHTNGPLSEYSRFDERRRNSSASRPRPTLSPANQQVYPSRPFQHHDSMGSMNVAFGSSGSLNGHEEGHAILPSTLKTHTESTKSLFNSDQKISLDTSSSTGAVMTSSNADEDSTSLQTPTAKEPGKLNEGPIPFGGESSADPDFSQDVAMKPGGSSSDSLTLEIDAIRSKVDDLRQKFMTARTTSVAGGDRSDTETPKFLPGRSDIGNSSEPTEKASSPLMSPLSGARPPSVKKPPVPVPPKPHSLRGGSGGKPSPISTTFPPVQVGRAPAPARTGPMSASGLAMSTSPSTLAELNVFDESMNRLDRQTLESSVACLVRNLRHTLALTLDVNQMLGEASETGMTSSATSLVRNMTDVQVSSMSMLLRMMEQFEKEQRVVMDALQTGTAASTSTATGASQQHLQSFGHGPLQKGQQITPTMSPERR